MSNNSSALRNTLSVLGKLFTGTRKGPSGSRVRLLKKCQKAIGVRFTDLSLLEQALTHRSYSHVTSQTRNASNERMEFLGDSVLGLAVSQFLYLRFPDRSEGALSKMKSLLVSRKVLSTVAGDLGLGEYLLLSGEESEMGGRERSSILADSFEGVLGAIYLDQGYRASNKFIQHFVLANIHGILDDEEHTNYKSLLQEYVQGKRLSHPVYRVRREEGPEHEKEFAIDVVVKGQVWGSGRGKSKKDAEQSAARAALEGRLSRDEAARRSRRSAGADEEDSGDGEGTSRRGGRGRSRSEGGRSEGGRSEGGRSEGGRSGRGRGRGRDAEVAEAETPTVEAPKVERSSTDEGRKVRGRSRGRSQPAGMESNEPQDRGEFGIAASRENLRSRRLEEDDEPVRERKGRAGRRAVEPVADEERSETTSSEAPDREGRSSSRRGGRGRRRGGRTEETPEIVETTETPGAEDSASELRGGGRSRSARRRRSRSSRGQGGEVAAVSGSEIELTSPVADAVTEPTSHATEPARAESSVESAPIAAVTPSETPDVPGFVRRRRRRPDRPKAAKEAVATTSEPTPPPTAAEVHEAPVEREAPVEVHEAPVEREAPVEAHEAPVEREAPVEVHEAPVEREAAVEVHEAPVEREAPVEVHETPIEREAAVEVHETPVEQREAPSEAREAETERHEAQVAVSDAEVEVEAEVEVPAPVDDTEADSGSASSFTRRKKRHARGMRRR